MKRQEEEPKDDNVSFKKAKTSKVKRLTHPSNILLLFIALLEIGAVVLLELQFNTICVQTMEIGPQVYTLLMCTYTFACPDLFMFVLMFVNDKIFFRPFGVLFHMVAFLFLLTSSLALLATLTFCGDPSQYFFLTAGLLDLLSGFMHFAGMIVLLTELPKETFPCLRKMCLCKCKEPKDELI